MRSATLRLGLRAAGSPGTATSGAACSPGLVDLPWLARGHAATPTPTARADAVAADQAEEARAHQPAPTASSSSTATTTTHLPDFSRPTWAAAPITDLARAWAVLAACMAGSGPGRPGLASHAARLLSAATAVAGRRATDAAVRATFFRVFCAGESLEDAVERGRALRAARIRGILNYAAESETSSAKTVAGTGVPEDGQPAASTSAAAAFDARTATFLEAVAATDTTPLPGEEAHGGGIGVTALKVSALGNADVLERASAVLVDRGGGLDRWAGLPPATGGDALAALRARLASGSTGLAPADVAAWDGLVSRVAAIADACAARVAAASSSGGSCGGGGGLRLIIDAEQTWVQPAVDALAIALMARHNKYTTAAADDDGGGGGGDFAVLNTYQHYLTDTPGRLAADAARAAREGWVLGAKPVRGAYMVAERAAAAAAGRPDPVHPSAAATHAAYDAALARRLIPGAADGAISVLVATHNQASVETAVRAMADAGLPPADARVLFGQLCGMRDFLTYTLASHGYRAYKILPYGALRETMLYLTRRAQENCDVLGNVGVDVRLLRAELVARARAAVFG